MWNVKCLYSFRDDLVEGLGKSVALECKKSASGRRSSLKNFFFFKLTFNTFRGGLFFRGGGGLLSNVLFTGSWTYNLGGGANKFCQFWYFVPFLYLTCLRFFLSR